MKLGTGMAYSDSRTCPVTGLSIKRSEKWTNIELIDGFMVSFALIGKNIVLVAPSGFSGDYGNNRFLEVREEFLKEHNLFEGPYVELKDYSQNMNRITKKGRLQVGKRMAEEAENGKLLALIGFNMPPMLKFVYNIARSMTRGSDFIYIKRDYEMAIRTALEILERKSGSVSGSVQQYKLGRKEDRKWNLDRPGYGVSFEIIGDDIVYNDAYGTLKLEYVDDFFELHRKILIEEGVVEKLFYYKIIDWSRFDRSRWNARSYYIEQMENLNRFLPCRLVVVYGLNNFMKAIIKTSRMLVRSNIVVASSLEEAIALINKDRKAERKDSGASKGKEKQKPVFTRREIENEIAMLMSHIGNINWEQEGYRLEEHEHNPVFSPLYDALALIKHDFDAMMVEKENVQKQLVTSARMASIGQLASGVGHEINNPLAIIKGYLEITIEDLEKMDKSLINENLEKIHFATDRISRIVDGLRVVARKDAAEDDLVDINEAIGEILDLNSIIYERERISVVRKFDAERPFIRGNRGYMHQIVMNLMSNAADALRTSDESNRVISITTANSDNSVVLTITDNGEGVEPGDLERIFEYFYTTKGVGKGTGLGLGIVDSFVKSMRGRIHAESSKGMGTSFHMSFPEATS